MVLGPPPQMGRVIGLRMGRELLWQKGEHVGQGDFTGAIAVQLHHQLLGFRFRQLKQLDQALQLGRLDRAPLGGIQQAEGGLQPQALVPQQHGEEQKAPLPWGIGWDPVGQANHLDFAAIDLDPGGRAGLAQQLGGGDPGLLA